jgi:hypothetical protein
LVLTSPTSAGRSVGLVRSWNQATEFFIAYFLLTNKLQREHEEHIKNRYLEKYAEGGEAYFLDSACRQLAAVD